MPVRKLDSGSASGFRERITGQPGLPTPMGSELLAKLWKEQNPNNEPSGPGTDRCGGCGATGENIWKSEEQWGCDVCGSIYNTP